MPSAPVFPSVSAARSANMRAIKSTDTNPELVVRRLVHSLGYRYRLHRKDLPGKPDLVFGPRRKVIFVHGCFWHGHDCRRGFRTPGENPQYWTGKIGRNVERDAVNQAKLMEAGWKILTVWECETAGMAGSLLGERLKTFLAS